MMVHTMNANKRIAFYNNFRNGDIHNSRGIITHIMKTLRNDYSYDYYHFNSQRILSDLNVNYIPSPFQFGHFCGFHQNDNMDIKNGLVCVTENGVYINTHIGSKYEDNIPFYSHGVNALGNMYLLNYIYKLLKLPVVVEDEWELVADLDYNKFTNTRIEDFLKNNNKKLALFCNGPVRSGQSNNFSFTEIINHLSKMYPNYMFMVTEKIISSNNNVVFVGDIIGEVGDSDLNEIGYLGNKSDLIVGRASGPFMFTQTKTTLDDSSKTFVSFNNDTRAIAFFSDLGKAKKIWSDNYDPSHMTQLLENAMNNTT